MAASLYKALYDLVEALGPVVEDMPEGAEEGDPQDIELMRAYKQAVETLEWESSDARR